MDSWPLEDAKARFGEMLDRCLEDGPQVVTRDGTEAAVLVPIGDWPRPAARSGGKEPRYATLKEWLMTDFARGDIPIPERNALEFRDVDFNE